MHMKGVHVWLLKKKIKFTEEKFKKDKFVEFVTRKRLSR